MPKTYEREGVSFQYPDNWILDEQEAAETGAVSVYSPQGAFWTVSIQPEDDDPNDLAEQALQAMREEYEDLESEPVEEWIAGHQAVGYDLNFWFLDLISTCLVRCISTDRATFVVFCQSEDREFDRIEPVFQAITASLLAGEFDAGFNPI